MFKVNICKECLNSLKDHKLPKYSLANNLYIGPVPNILEGYLILNYLNNIKLIII